MNERLSKIGDQVKQAFGRVRDAWMRQEAVRRRRVLIIGLGLIVFAIVLMIVLNVVQSRYVVLYEGLGVDETTQARAVLETAGIPSRINNSGELEVPKNQDAAAIGQLAMQGLPSDTLDYSVFAEASGLTTTESERREYLKFQWQDRLQDIIKTMTGVQNAFVTLVMPSENARVWDADANRGSGTVYITMRSGYVLSPSVANAIRFLVGPSVGIEPEQVSVLDSDGNLLAAAGEEYTAQDAVATTFLERMDLAATVERDLENKAAQAIAVRYQDPATWSVVCTVQLDFDQMVTEIKDYIPEEGTLTGVVDSDELDVIMSPDDLTAGVVGETDNTDIPIYVDENGDAIADMADYHRFTDYAVSYTLQQIEKDGPSMAGASISVNVADAALGFDGQEALRDSVAAATGIPRDNVIVTGFTVPPIDDPTGGGGSLLPGNIPDYFLYIAAAAVVALILILVLVMMMRKRSKKKKLVAELAAEQAALEEAERVQREIEERKQQLKDAAMGEPGEDAIINEVRDFARANPEITAGLLRNWLKDET